MAAKHTKGISTKLAFPSRPTTTAGCAPGWRSDLPGVIPRWRSDLEDLAGPHDVLGHRLDQLLDALEADHATKPLDEGHLDLDAIELEVGAVKDVGLPATLPQTGRAACWEIVCQSVSFPGGVVSLKKKQKTY